MNKIKKVLSAWMLVACVLPVAAQYPVIPDSAKEKPQQGVVIAVGAGKKDEPMTVKVGDKVLYGKYSGNEISVDGKKYLIMHESDIFAII